MNQSFKTVSGYLVWAFALTLVAAGCGSMGGDKGGERSAKSEAPQKSEAAAKGQAVKVALSGDKEVPPVQTKATGNGTITVGQDKSVSGSVTTSGVEGTAA